MPKQKKYLKMAHVALGSSFVIFGSLSLAVILYGIFVRLLLPTNYYAPGLNQNLIAMDGYTQSRERVKGVKTINWWQLFLNWLR